MLTQLPTVPISMRVDCDQAEAQLAEPRGNSRAAETTLQNARKLPEGSGDTYLSAYTAVLSDLGGIYRNNARYSAALRMARLVGATHEPPVNNEPEPIPR